MAGPMAGQLKMLLFYLELAGIDSKDPLPMKESKGKGITDYTKF
jgi:hypothetical protein